MYWCIDIYIISYVVQKVKKEDIPKNISKDILASLLDTYFKNMHKNMNSFAFPMSDDEIRKLKEKHFDFFTPYIGQPWETLIDVLLKPEYYSTWDIYSSAITYMIICRIIDISQYNSQKINNLTELWKSIIIALPNERKTFEQIKEI